MAKGEERRGASQKRVLKRVELCVHSMSRTLCCSWGTLIRLIHSTKSPKPATSMYLSMAPNDVCLLCARSRVNHFVHNYLSYTERETETKTQGPQLANDRAEIHSWLV